jgi:hypothetical protein
MNRHLAPTTPPSRFCVCTYGCDLVRPWERRPVRTPSRVLSGQSFAMNGSTAGLESADPIRAGDREVLERLPVGPPTPTEVSLA